MRKKKKHLLYTFLKIGVAIFLLYAVFTKIPFTHIQQVVIQANKGLLFIALLCFVGSQWISAERLQLLFRSLRFFISAKSNYKLYLIGMFYNFFIPGGIGGDAYKVYVLNKEFHWSVKKLTAAVFVDRVMGLTAIGILVVILGLLISYEEISGLSWLLPFLLIGGIGLSYLFIKRWFISFLQVFTKTLLQSLAVQLLQCLCIVMLLAGVTDIEQYMIYVLVFLVSSVLSIFSFSGIGVREMIFYQAATLFSFDTAIAVTIGLLFSAITAFVSLFGMIFHFRKSASYIKNRQYIH